MMSFPEHSPVVKWHVTLTIKMNGFTSAAQNLENVTKVNEIFETKVFE
jgi:hypothetical protein